MTSARERQKQRQERQRRAEMAVRIGSTPAQVSANASAKPPRRPRPSPALRGGRWLLLLPVAVLFFIGVVLAIGALNPPEAEQGANALWLTDAWTQSTRPNEDYIALAQRLKEHQIGTLYAYASSLREDATWSGGAGQRARFSEAESAVQDFVARMAQVAPEVQVFAWLEVYATPLDRYRLDSPQVQRSVADFAARMMNEFAFDGVLLDVKPVFDGNEDMLTLVRAVRSSIGLEARLALAVPPDFTPPDGDFALPPQIAPNTVWSAEYKQRVSLQADQVVVAAYSSYISDPLDYIAWVSYQTQSFATALTNIDSSSALLISVPHYADALPAHNSAIESLPAGLDGVRRALAGLSAPERALLQGIAIYADGDLTDEDWALFRSKWLAP